MNVRKEALSWVITVLVAIVTSLVVVQLSTALAFASQDWSPLEVAALRQRLADYGADESDAPELQALDASLVEEAAEENGALERTNDERGQISLPAAPAPAPNLIEALLASPTAVPTLVVTLPPTATLQATHTPAGPSPSALPNTATTAPSVTTTQTAVVRSLTPTASASATVFATSPSLVAPNIPAVNASTSTGQTFPTFTTTATFTLTTGAQNPSATATQAVTATSTPTRTFTATATFTRTVATTSAAASATRTSTATATQTATSTATPTATPTVTATATASPTIPSNVALSLNFQPAGASIPNGYLVDSGASFGDRGNGWQYGWNQANNTAVDRDSRWSPDQRFDTVMALEWGGASEWNIALPNGVYTVHIVAGDACCDNANYRIRVEDVTVVNGRPRNGALWVEGTAQVTVSDGRLTVRSGFGAHNNKINFIEIYSGTQAPAATAMPSATPRTPTATNSPTASRTPTASKTPTPTRTLAPSKTLTPSTTFTASWTPTITPSQTPTASSTTAPATLTWTPSPSPEASPTSTETEASPTPGSG